MDRSTFLALAGAFAVCRPRPSNGSDVTLSSSSTTLSTAPLELGGEWGGSAPNDAMAVIARMREASLAGIRLFSDQQPQKLRVDDHASGPPAVWLHSNQPETAWVIVDIGARDWCKLAYQFGHELGHVLCNSWRWGDAPKPPSQWLEEAMVEAFSIRGLALLADSWERNPPFPHDNAFAGAIRDYRAKLLAGYRKAADIDFAAWLRAGRPALASGASAPEGPAVAPIVAELEREKGCVEDLGAVNRWPGRSALPVEDYLRAWQKSCGEREAPGVLPGRITTLLGLG
jgi:hypothetical protein